MPTEKAAPHRAKKEKSRVYSFFLLSYTLILLVSLSSCLFFGAEVAQQLRREEALNKQALLTSLKNDVEENLRYVEELGNSLVFNSRLQFLVKHPSVSSVHDAMDQMAGMAVSRDFLLDYFLYVRSTDEVVTSTVRMSADKFRYHPIYRSHGALREARWRNTIFRIIFRGRAASVRFRHGDPRHSLRPVHPSQQRAPPDGDALLTATNSCACAALQSLRVAASMCWMKQARPCTKRRTRPAHARC
ncbi:MAG: hypothetical protein ACLR7U_06575 [Ruthenibacterium lactatiformans]